MGKAVHHISQGGISGTHDLLATEDIVLAPTTEQELNTLKLPLIPIACWGLYDPPFQFDSSFIGPLAQQEMGFLADLRELLKQQINGKTLYPPLSIFGHADPAGPPDPDASDAYNKQLSGRRAMAVYGLLIRDPDIWEYLFSSHQQCSGGDTWGLRSIQTMLKALPQRPPSEPPRKRWPYDPGPADGVMGPCTQQALQQFQHDEGLPPSGNPDKLTRRKLFATYMEYLCSDEKGKLRLEKLQKTDFLAQMGDKDSIVFDSEISDDITGVQSMLNALGFRAGDLNGAKRRQTTDALIAYQRDRQLKVTGDIDNETKNALNKDHGLNIS